MDLKNRVESKGYLWGIIDMEKAEVTALEQGYRIEDLQGKYGLKVNENELHSTRVRHWNSFP